ncbi:DMT family transporter [uncultured Odoribacter sp.]|uniref:DMT family transporter n=1 Tax=uncultured Odoribacter sp. TaxID=876416 RepID=UPI00262934F2|nr:DMT family transporter [uncultured Odoribacter sp.]
MKSRELIGNLMVLATILIYSFNTNFMKVLMPEWIGPQGLVLARCLMCAIGFWIIGLFLPHTPGNNPGRRDIGMMMLGGVLGIGANLLLYISGLNITGPVDSFVIRTLQPIMVLLLAVLILHVKFTKYKMIGIILGLGGAVYVSIMPHNGPVKDSFLGDIMIFASTVSKSLFLVLIKPYTQKYNAFVVMKWMGVAALIVTFPFGIRQLLQAPLFSTTTPLHIWMEFGFILIVTTMGAYYLSVKALNYITPFVESAYIYLLPITGAIVTILMGLQKFSWHDPIALALIVLGFIFINKKAHPSATITPLGTKK